MISKIKFNYFERYEKNLNPFTKQEIETVFCKSVCVAGCGGLGGHVAVTLARFGLGRLTLVDGDVFNRSNLNRQLFCTEYNLGKNKADETKKALSAINSSIEIKVIQEFLDESNAERILSNHDAVIDCLDNIPARILLESACETAGVPLVHGAISGFTGQVTCVFPGDKSIQKLYAGYKPETHVSRTGNPPFTPQLVAAIQCCEVIKLLTGRGNVLMKKLLLIDLCSNEFDIIDLA